MKAQSKKWLHCPEIATKTLQNQTKSNELLYIPEIKKKTISGSNLQNCGIVQKI